MLLSGSSTVFPLLAWSALLVPLICIILISGISYSSILESVGFFLQYKQMQTVIAANTISGRSTMYNIMKPMLVRQKKHEFVDPLQASAFFII